MGLTDSHAHLDDSRFDPDRKDVLDRAWQAGLERILTIANGATPDDFHRTIDLLALDQRLWAAVGIHPHEARHATDELLQEVEELAQSPRILAWGEIGLDYHYHHSPRDLQQQVFRRQLQAARRLKLPVIIHCREAWPDCLHILRDEWAAAALGGILHCFSGTLEDARQALEWGFLISFAGNVTFPRADDLRRTAAALPLECLLVETDCPYLAPQRQRGRRNEPAFVVEVAEFLADLHRMSGEESGALTSANFLRLFPRAQS